MQEALERLQFTWGYVKLSPKTTQQLAAKGMGVAFATVHTGRSPGLPLTYIPIANTYQPWIMGLYWRKDHVFTADAQIFFDFIKVYFSGKINEHTITFSGLRNGWSATAIP